MSTRDGPPGVPCTVVKGFVAELSPLPPNCWQEYRVALLMPWRQDEGSPCLLHELNRLLQTPYALTKIYSQCFEGHVGCTHDVLNVPFAVLHHASWIRRDVSLNSGTQVCIHIFTFESWAYCCRYYFPRHLFTFVMLAMKKATLLEVTSVPSKSLQVLQF
jgi:hypothetical protein